MSAITTTHKSSTQTQLKRIAWMIILILALYFFFKHAFPYFSLNKNSYGQYGPRWGGLLLHIVGGTFALLLGPTQFWAGLRQRYPRLHRWTGRLYFGGVVLGSAGAFYLSLTTPVSQAFGIALFTLAVVWLLTSSMALVAILRRQVANHKEWVTRSYVLTFAFVIGRVLLDSPFLGGMTNPKDRLVTIIWLCWTVPLFITEVVLQWNRSPVASRKNKHEIASPSWDKRAA